MKVNTVEVDGDTLSTRKEVEVESKEFKTPAKALQIGKIRTSETVSQFARGIAEIYKKVDGAGLENSRTGWPGLAQSLERQAKGADEDEFIVPFVEYDDTAPLTAENAAEIAKLQTNFGDILPVPIMLPLVRAADDGDDRSATHVSSIIENTRVFLEAVDSLSIEKPVMGVIPPISTDCTRALLDLYARYGIRMYCVDFNRRSLMARSQLDHVINPLMQTLAAYDIRQESLLYAVNARYSRPASDGHRTPDSMYGYTLGFDVIGDNHIAPNYPEEVFEKIAQENQNGEIEMRLFDADSLSIVEVSINDLDSFLPGEAEIPIERVQHRISQDPDEKYRFRNLINSELISLYLESEGGVDPREIFVGLDSGKYTQESDLERIRELTAEVGSS